MAMNIKSIVVLLIYAIGINVVLLSASQSNIGFECADLSQDFNSSYVVSNVSTIGEARDVASTFVNIALGRCEGVPAWFFWLIEAPVIVGLLYIIRGFIGVT